MSIQVTTIEEARVHLKANWRKGTKCPCCGQFVKLYSRRMTGASVLVLVALYHQEKEAWIQVEDLIRRENLPKSCRGDFHKLRFWELIERKEGKREDESDRLGLYRITDKGRAFVEGKIAVPSNVLLYNHRFIGLEGEPVRIADVLPVRFDYKSLMSQA